MPLPFFFIMPLNDCNPHFQTYRNWRTEIYNIVKIGKGIKKNLMTKITPYLKLKKTDL